MLCFVDDDEVVEGNTVFNKCALGTPPPPPTIILDGAIKNRRIFERKESVFCLVHHYVNK